MKKHKPPRIQLSRTVKHATEPLAVFALLNLGLVQSLASGVVTPEDAVDTFYHAGNCLFARRDIHSKTADAVMSHGTQLADLFAVAEH